MINKINNFIIQIFSNNGVHRHLCVCANFCIITAFMFWQYLPIGSFYVLDSFAWFVFMFMIYGIGITYLKDRAFNYIVAFGVLSSFNNFLDETLYQNLKLTYAELVFSIIITTTLILMYVKRRNISKYK